MTKCKIIKNQKSSTTVTCENRGVQTLDFQLRRLMLYSTELCSQIEQQQIYNLFFYIPNIFHLFFIFSISASAESKEIPCRIFFESELPVAFTLITWAGLPLKDCLPLPLFQSVWPVHHDFNVKVFSE